MMTHEHTVTIRTAAHRDGDLLATLNAFVQELHVAERPDIFKPAQRREVADWFEQLLRKATVHIWIAESQGAPIGYVVALLRERTEGPFCLARRWYEIDQIAVAPDHREKGVGRLLVETVLAEARAEGIRNVEANCWAWNEVAHQAFRGCGFASKEIRFEL